MGPNTDDWFTVEEGWTPRPCDYRSEAVDQTHSIPEWEGVYQLCRVHCPQPQPVWIQHRNDAIAVYQRLRVRCGRDWSSSRRVLRHAGNDERISSDTFAAVPVQQPPSSFLIHKVIGKLHLCTTERRQHLLTHPSTTLVTSPGPAVCDVPVSQCFASRQPRFSCGWAAFFKSWSNTQLSTRLEMSQTSCRKITREI